MQVHTWAEQAFLHHLPEKAALLALANGIRSNEAGRAGCLILTSAVGIQVDAQVAASEAMEQTGLAVDEQDGLSAALDDKSASLQRLQDELDCIVRERDAAAQQASHIRPHTAHPAPMHLAICGSDQCSIWCDHVAGQFVVFLILNKSPETTSGS